jgi:aspartyl-tRNA(Asn)/glutamyl-tRNA(Gln) amidotransferase subunit A
LKSLEDGLQDKYKVFVSMNKEEIIRHAAASTKRYTEGKPLSILDGVPVAVKDMIDVYGLVMKDGSASHEDEQPALADDPIVFNLRVLGAIVLGTTTMTEGGVTPLGYCAAEKVLIVCHF